MVRHWVATLGSCFRACGGSIPSPSAMRWLGEAKHQTSDPRRLRGSASRSWLRLARLRSGSFVGSRLRRGLCGRDDRRYEGDVKDNRRKRQLTATWLGSPIGRGTRPRRWVRHAIRHGALSHDRAIPAGSTNVRAWRSRRPRLDSPFGREPRQHPRLTPYECL